MHRVHYAINKKCASYRAPPYSRQQLTLIIRNLEYENIKQIHVNIHNYTIALLNYLRNSSCQGHYGKVCILPKLFYITILYKEFTKKLNSLVSVFNNDKIKSVLGRGRIRTVYNIAIFFLLLKYNHDHFFFRCGALKKGNKCCGA